MSPGSPGLLALPDLLGRLAQERAARAAATVKAVEDFVSEKQRKQPSDWQQSCEKENLFNHKGLVMSGHVTGESITRLPRVASPGSWKNIMNELVDRLRRRVLGRARAPQRH